QFGAGRMRVKRLADTWPVEKNGAMQLAELPLPIRDRTPTAELLSRLLQITRANQTSSCVRVCARSAHALRSVDIDTPLLALPIHGRKRYRDSESDRWIRVVPGEIFLISQPTSVDIENIPDASNGWYTAICIPLEEHVLNAARQLVREPATAVDRS